MDNNNGDNFNNKNYPNGSFNNPNTTPPNDYNQQNYNYNQNGYNQQNYNYNQQNYGFPNKPVDPGQNMAIASLVLGILGCLLPYGIGIILAILAIVFSVVSANKSQEVGLKRNGMATAGLICGIVSCALGLLSLIACFTCGGCALCYGGSASHYPYY